LDKEAAKRADDLLDCFVYGVALSLANAEGFWRWLTGIGCAKNGLTNGAAAAAVPAGVRGHRIREVCSVDISRPYTDVPYWSVHDPGCVKTLSGMTAPGILRPVVAAWRYGNVAARGARAAAKDGENWRPCRRESGPLLTLFRKYLRDLGYVEGQNVLFEFRSAQGAVDRLADLAAELVRLRVDLIVTWFTQSSQAAKQATNEIPIVMAEAGDPVGTGLVASLPRPGGKITGIAAVTAELAGKSVEFIREIMPSASRVAALCNAADPFSKPFLEQIQLAAATAGINVRPFLITRPSEEFDAAFSQMGEQGIDAIIVQPSLPTKHAADLALKHRLPSVSVPKWFAEEGGLMAYSASPADNYRQAAVYVDKILKGTKPADLPIVQPTKFELVINLKTAKALGLKIPESFLLRADELIE
jgi:putative tryptophan/tyrosine transport system substrate-binding protein